MNLPHYKNIEVARFLICGIESCTDIGYLRINYFVLWLVYELVVAKFKHQVAREVGGGEKSVLLMANLSVTTAE